VCGRYTNTAGPEELNARLRVPIDTSEGTRRYNIAPTQKVLAIVAPEGDPQARLLRWGLVPPWSKDLKSAYKMINARTESVTTKPSYRGLIGKGSHRALQIADGYFEWLKPERRGEPRQPFHFQVDGGVPFAFASLWTSAQIEGERVESCTLLTCDSESNGVAHAIHNRMPVILPDLDLQRAWLDPGLDTEDVLELCRPLSTERLSARPANPALNRVDRKAEGPELLIAPAGHVVLGAGHVVANAER
jgi:putative SOS response-associated peptidase YedK